MPVQEEVSTVHRLNYRETLVRRSLRLHYGTVQIKGIFAQEIVGPVGTNNVQTTPNDIYVDLTDGKDVVNVCEASWSSNQQPNLSKNLEKTLHRLYL
ncbi:hypothetical protein PPTG_24526 [Phytophthora nicotianae INRA-310]|uniref:Uncharacterized protein n=1 Tax=Phytophthora nicotianae (strain INRA-310) TaxID=761204 RepID=W2PFC8_PHYN3|nr:hypothetical protein PPTG_24526 [Phytophthora nicotianae INRA-310]ETM98913.1 hypothetical protein PPTG_24526 [Phytophthora nicotianae INRA-310]